jgi:hypothetical protein
LHEFRQEISNLFDLPGIYISFWTKRKLQFVPLPVCRLISRHISADPASYSGWGLLGHSQFRKSVKTRRSAAVIAIYCKEMQRRIGRFADLPSGGPTSAHLRRCSRLR